MRHKRSIVANVTPKILKFRTRLTFCTRVACFEKHRQSGNASFGVSQFRIRNSNFTLSLPRASGVKYWTNVGETAKESWVSCNLLTFRFCTSASMATPVKSLLDDDDFSLPALWVERLKLAVLFRRI